MKTVNLELSKQLKEAGYPQNMDWIYSWYCSEPDCEEKELQTRDDNYCESCGLVVEGILSPTADEILEQLPSDIKNNHFDIYKDDRKGFKKWELSYTPNNDDRVICSFEDDSLADAAAKLWLYLKQNNLLEVKE